MNTLEEIKRYIAEPNTVGALLVTGKWGCGKTYLIENELHLDEEVSKSCHIFRISLFGEESATAITRKVKRKMMFANRLKRADTEKPKSGKIKTKSDDKEGSINKIVSGLKIVSTIAGSFTPIGNAVNAIASVDVTEFYECEKMINDKKVVLIFDDFERSKLDHKDLLGCINEFVENYGIKTIIITNEEKIDLYQNNNADENNHQDNSKDTTKMPTGANLNKSQYQELKEKVISRTIKLVPDHRAIIDQIIAKSEYNLDSYKAFTATNIDLIEKVFTESLTDNIRSLKCALQDFERVYKIIILVYLLKVRFHFSRSF